MLDPKYGFIHSCPTNLGTGMRASVHVDLPGYTKEGLPALKARWDPRNPPLLGFLKNEKDL